MIVTSSEGQESKDKQRRIPIIRKGYGDFHTAFIKLCSEFNTIMPGKHYILTADSEKIKKFYTKEWKASVDSEAQVLLMQKLRSRSNYCLSSETNTSRSTNQALLPWSPLAWSLLVLPS